MNVRAIASFLPFLLAVQSPGGPLFAHGPSRRMGGKAEKRHAAIVEVRRAKRKAATRARKLARAKSR